MSDLIPTRIVDRNGKITTVHKRQVVSSSGRKKLETVVLVDPETRECEKLQDQINSRLRQMGLALPSRPPETLGSARTMPKEQLHQTLRLLHSYLGKQSLVDKIDAQHFRLNAERFGQWLSGMDRITARITESNERSDAGESKRGNAEGFDRYSLDVVSETVMGVVKLKEKNQKAREFTDQQSDDLVMMTLYACKLKGNDLQSMTYSAFFGDHLEHSQPTVMDFYLRHPESLDRVREIVDSEDVKRFAELEDLINGESSPAMVSGVL